MRTVDDGIEGDKKALGVLGEAMARLADLNGIVGSTAWLHIDEWIGRHVTARLRELANPNTADNRTHALRGEIAALELVRGLPASVLRDLDTGKQQAKDLQDRLAKWHNRGRPELRPAVDTATQLADRSKP